MAQAAAPWYPRLIPGCLKNMGNYEVFENNTVYSRFLNSDGKGITVNVWYVSQVNPGCLTHFDRNIQIPAREGIDFATKGTDIALYPEDHREYIASIVKPIVKKWLEH